MHKPSRLAVSLLAVGLLVSGAAAQQFIEQQVSRFPQPALTEYTNQLAFGDIDGDGDLDVVFANGGNFSTQGAPQKLRIFINNGSAVFADETDARTGGITLLARDAQFADVDKDGDLDMAVATDFSTQPRLFMNNGSGFFTDQTVTRLTPPINIGGSHCGFGDIDNDGDLDLIFTNGGTNRFGSGQTQLFLNDGAGFFTNATAGRLPVQNISQPLDCQFGDIDADLDLDVVIGSRANGQSKLYRNNGAGFFSDITAGNLPATNNLYAFDFGDFNNDGDLDLLGVNADPGSSRETMFDNNGTGTFTNVSATVIPGANNPNIDDNDSRFIDLDYDGDLDFFVGALGGGTERAYINNNNVYTLTNGVFQAVNDSTLDIEVGDLDGDNDLDVVTGQGESGSFINRIYMNQGAAKDNRAPKIITLEQVAPGASAPYVVRAVVRDDMTTDTNFFYDEIVLEYSVNGGGVVPLDMMWSGGDIYRAEIPAQSCTAVDYRVSATDAAGNTTVSSVLTFDAPATADLTGDGAVNQDDLNVLLADFGCPGPGCAADLTGDGATNQDDLNVLLAQFGLTCP